MPDRLPRRPGSPPRNGNPRSPQIPPLWGRRWSFHQHLPHYELTAPEGDGLRVLGRQRVDPHRPHPFTTAGNTEFNAVIWMPPAGNRAADIVLIDSTHFTTLFGGTDSLRNLWRNLATMSRPNVASRRRWTYCHSRRCGDDDEGPVTSVQQRANQLGAANDDAGSVRTPDGGSRNMRLPVPRYHLRILSVAAARQPFCR